MNHNMRQKVNYVWNLWEWFLQLPLPVHLMNHDNYTEYNGLKLDLI